MSLLEAIVMGIIQGLTEFLPVSSSGHLSLFKILLGIETDTGILFDVLLHMGTLIAIIVAFRKDLLHMLGEAISILRDFFEDIRIFTGNIFGRKDEPYYKLVDNSYRKFVMLVMISTIPTAIIGYTAKEVVEAAATTLLVPGCCLIVTALLLFFSDCREEGMKTPRNVTYSNAFLIGICQGVATLPGLSRSGTTIAVCLLSGFNRKFAVKYSFIMSIPAILGAVVLELANLSKVSITSTEVGYCLAGMACAAVVGYVSIRTMLVVVKNKKFKFFGIYCLIIGIISIAGHFMTA